MRENNYKSLVDESSSFMEYVANLEKEVQFLRQRNKDLRQKTWINVYNENLQLTAENQHLKEVLKSVETFVNQYTF